MMRRGAQLESGQCGGRMLLLLCACGVGAGVVRWEAQSVPPSRRCRRGQRRRLRCRRCLQARCLRWRSRRQAPTTVVEPTLPGMPPAQGEEVDRVVAIVNGQLILDSDVDRERRFAVLLHLAKTTGPYNRDEAIERLINRDLILQQAQLQPGYGVTQEAASRDLDTLRKSLPTCAKYHCETEEGWDKFLATEGFTEESLTSLWRQRMEVLAFIEQRFRMGIRILPAEIEEYYTKTMLPEYAAQGVEAPPLRTISRRIQEVLLQQRVSKLLDDWLTSLRAQGNVVVLHAGEEAR